MRGISGGEGSYEMHPPFLPLPINLTPFPSLFPLLISQSSSPSPSKPFPSYFLTLSSSSIPSLQNLPSSFTSSSFPSLSSVPPSLSSLSIPLNPLSISHSPLPCSSLLLPHLPTSSYPSCYLPLSCNTQTRASLPCS